jgi:hypothetical protein
MKFYTKNKAMYFEVCECEGIFGKGKYKLDAFNRIENTDDYTFEREITEGMVFNSEKDAKIIAEHLSYAYNWGYDDCEDGK